MLTRLVLSLVVALLMGGGLAAEAMATADVTRLGGNINLSVRAESGSDGDHGIVLDNIRPGDMRYGQQAFGNPTITSNTCRTNPLFNDVVCEGALFEVANYTMTLGDGADRVRVRENRDANPCHAGAAPSFLITVNLGDGADTFDTQATGTAPSCPDGGFGLQPSFRYRLVVSGGDGGDAIDAQNAGSAELGGGGSGDTLRGSNGPDAMSGGSGEDNLDGRGGDDTLSGGASDDILQGFGGNDTLDGGFSSDFLGGGEGDDLLLPLGGANDSVTGGPGFDTADYGAASGRIVVTIGNNADDGLIVNGESERDAIGFDVEEVIGGVGGDLIVGRFGAQTLRGGRGNDTLEGREDNDTLIGGPGVDSLQGGDGADDIDAVDGEADIVSCGGQFADGALVDLVDKVAGCGFLLRRAVDDAPPGQPVGRRLRISRAGVASVEIACPADAAVPCRGRVAVRDPRRAGRSLGTAGYDIALGASQIVGVRLSRGERARLRRRGRALVTTRERGISQLGPRSAQTTMRIP